MSSRERWRGKGSGQRENVSNASRIDQPCNREKTPERHVPTTLPAQQRKDLQIVTFRSSESAIDK